MIRTQIQLTGEQYRKVKAVAQQEDISMAQAIRNAIDEWLERRSELTQAERWERSLSAIGKFHNGVSDLAENHDEYLTEAYGSYEEK